MRYLEHLKGVSSLSARNAQLSDISLDSLTIEASGKTYVIALDPPLPTWRDARERVVQMDKDARAALGRSDVAVTAYTRPRGVHAALFGTLLLAFGLLARPANLRPGSYLYDHALKYAPGFAAGALKARSVLPVILGAHLVECGVLARKLNKYNVLPLSGLWWKWELSCVVEGFPCFRRVEALAAEARVQKEKQKH